jgi:NADH:ubiquinone oxidoreductase subunit H
MDERTKWNIRGFSLLLAFIGSLFVGGWAGPLGVVLWLYLSSLYLYINGFTWENLRFCFVFSLMMWWALVMLKRAHEEKRSERVRRVGV